MRYKYYCYNCKKEIVLEHSTDHVEIVCPECKEKQLTRIIKSVPIHFKGSGFYCTDYK